MHAFYRFFRIVKLNIRNFSNNFILIFYIFEYLSNSKIYYLKESNIRFNIRNRFQHYYAYIYYSNIIYII